LPKIKRKFDFLLKKLLFSGKINSGICFFFERAIFIQY